MADPVHVHARLTRGRVNNYRARLHCAASHRLGELAHCSPELAQVSSEALKALRSRRTVVRRGEALMAQEGAKTFQRIAGYYREQILTGDIKPGTKLPGHREMAKR